MPRGPCKFTERDVKRAMRAAFAAGAATARVEIVSGDGTRLCIEGSKIALQPANDLDRELEDFEARHAGDIARPKLVHG